MTEASARVIPVEANLNEEVHTLFDHLRRFAHRNRDVLTILGGMVVSVYVTRAMFRRELTRLQFNVEVFPFEQLTSTDYTYDD